MYQIKHYDKDKTLIQTINPRIVKNEVSFTKQINWWLWQFSLSLALPITNDDYTEWDLIEVYSTINKVRNLIYVWYIEEIIREISTYEEIRLKINGLASLFKRIIYNVAWNYSPTLSWDPFTLVSDIITFINTKYNYFTVEGSLTWASVSYSANYTDCYSLITNLNNVASNYYWFLDNYTLIFKAKPSTAEHTFTVKKDLVELTIEEDAIWIVNSLILTYATWTKTYQDATSISTYWIREKNVTDTNIWNVTSADIYWAKYLAENKDPKKQTSIVVSDKFSSWILVLSDFNQNLNTYTLNISDYKYRTIENLKPWESCKIRNLKKQLSDNLIIQKITYNRDNIIVDLERFENFIWLIKQ